MDDKPPSYNELLATHFALSGARVFQTDEPSYISMWLYILPGRSSSNGEAFHSREAAMRGALRALGVELCDATGRVMARWQHEK